MFALHRNHLLEMQNTKQSKTQKLAFEIERTRNTNRLPMLFCLQKMELVTRVEIMAEIFPVKGRYY